MRCGQTCGKWCLTLSKAFLRTAALRLEPVVRPVYRIRRNFWTGGTEFSVTRMREGSGSVVCLNVLLVSHEDRPLLSVRLGGSSGDFVGSILGGPEMALALTAMKPGDKLTWFFRKPWGDGYWLFDGKDLVYLESYRAGKSLLPERIRPDDLVNGTAFEGEDDPNPTFAIPMMGVIVVAYALLFPWRRPRRAAPPSQEV